MKDLNKRSNKILEVIKNRPAFANATSRQSKIEEVINKRQEGVIVLEDIHDPHNAAAVWRSCDAFGFQKVYLIFEQEEMFNPKRVGKASSSSANKWLDFEVFKTTSECVAKLKKNGYKTIATVLDKKAKRVEETELTDNKIAVMFGNEHRGLSPTAIKLADEKMYIPMKGMVQSLNLSVTAAIVMYEINQQRQNKGNFRLESKERGRLKIDWQYR